MSATDSLIYLDNNATTATDAAVVDEMLPYLREQYGNPSSPYRLGKEAANAIERARERVAKLLGCEAQEIVFTSCGTESTNAAIHSALNVDPDRQHIVTTRVEHSATLKTCEQLAKKGYEISWIGVDGRGQIDLEELEKKVRPDTALITAMWANNETGTLFPMAAIAEIAKNKGVYFHTDAVQAVGKVPMTKVDEGISFMSLSGHKLHCPKGIGALYVNRRTRFVPFMSGGSQENYKRAGTQNVAFIVGFGKACEMAFHSLIEDENHMRTLRDEFESTLRTNISGIQLNGDPEHRLPNTTNLAFENVDAEMLLQLLDEQNVACSAGSACTAGSINPSHVLKAMGCSDRHARSSLRFSFSRYNTQQEMLTAVKIIEASVSKIRSILSP